MINGLQAIVPGSDVKKFIREAVAIHKEKAKTYQAQVDALAAAGVNASHMSGDPKSGAMSKVESHKKLADELEFLFNYIDVNEKYVLSTHDLSKLFKVSNQF